ncbi:TRAP transporter small permease subunit [Paracoccus liaowanqingii]|uniref:TRAP transporter small permease protein n=1 Tax=Paracoccus liaowanqingii TaxID=2560053 RepID=A0A4P7HIP5_9RHOB|nr:TRAP transporter small permease subunit [Paracoccus liaowanqingii]QBX33968.1 TRAP transporter small permease subunit [Paracoccus liaowanqingii]
MEPQSPQPGPGGASPPVLRAAGGVASAVEASGKVIAVSCLAFMFVALLVNVILRYFFAGGIPWAYEIHALLMPWLVAGGVVIAAANGANIAITLLPGMLGERGAQILLIVVQALIVIISVSVLVSSRPILVASQYQRLSTLGITQVWGYASLVYAFGGMALLAGIDILRVIWGGQTWDRDPASNSLS